jgi:hypothetical protein
VRGAISSDLHIFANTCTFPLDIAAGLETLIALGSGMTFRAQKRCKRAVTLVTLLPSSLIDTPYPAEYF